MAVDDARRWDERWAAVEGAVGGAWPDVIADTELIDLLPTSGRALDVACGRGAQAIRLAQHGLDVIAIDASQVAVDHLRTSVESIHAELGDDVVHGHVADRIDARVHDLDTGLPDDAVDLDVVVCQRYRQPTLYLEFVERLAIGGIAIVTVLSETGAETPGPFHAPPGELADAFDRNDVEVVHHLESDGQESIVIRRTSTS